jgi:hypothetical protein
MMSTCGHESFRLISHLGTRGHVGSLCGNLLVMRLVGVDVAAARGAVWLVGELMLLVWALGVMRLWRRKASSHVGNCKKAVSQEKRRNTVQWASHLAAERRRAVHIDWHAYRRVGVALGVNPDAASSVPDDLGWETGLVAGMACHRLGAGRQDTFASGG